MGSVSLLPMPTHHHLPNWVRRAHGQVAQRVSEIMGGLHGTAREQLSARIEAMTSEISSGKFSVAWQYPDLLAYAEKLSQEQRAEDNAAYAARRSIDVVRKRAEAQLRAASAGMPADVASRLGRELGSATDVDGIRAVETQIAEAARSVASVAERKRTREIEKTKSRLARAIATKSGDSTGQESWQDVLRRFAEEQAATQQDQG